MIKIVTESGEYKYAQTVNEQYNPNSIDRASVEVTTKQSRWSNMVNANGSDTRNSAKCYYTKKGDDYYVPATITAHNFQLDIPEFAYVNEVTIELCISTDNPSIRVDAPRGGFMVEESIKGAESVPQNWNDTGWRYNEYWVYPHVKLSTSEQIIEYKISGYQWNKIGYPTTELNKSFFGMDFVFETPEKSTEWASAGVLVNWVRVKVYYDMPHTILRWDSQLLDMGNPYELELNKTHKIHLTYYNPDYISAGSPNRILIELPFGLHLEGYEITDLYSHLEVVDEFKGQYMWYCDGDFYAKNNIYLNVHADTYGVKVLTATNLENNFSIDGFVAVNGFKGEYSEAHISSGDIQKATPSCFTFRTKVISYDENIRYTIVVDGENQADSSKVSQTVKDFYNNPTGEHNYLAKWELSKQSKSLGISIDWEHTDNDHIQFNIPQNTPVEIEWKGCFLPVTVGENTLYLVDGDSGETYYCEYISYEAKTTKAKFFLDDVVWYDHRIATELDMQAYIIPFATKDTDRYMVETDCDFALHIQKLIPYIGCVPLIHSHHDPKSDFTNKSIKNTYKNKIYTGKTGEIDENITFQLHLPPQDWTTLQGLCEMDKPVPVNAVPTAFEGDVLNHRGWVELNGVKNVQKTNPLYYKGDLDVEYITHNINTRFQISKGVAVSQYTTDVIKDFVDYAVEIGDEFADYTYTNTDGDIVHNNTGYFDVDTDGTYIYDPDNKRTLMTMDNNQYISIKSVYPLAESTKIAFNWESTKILEDKENNIERIIRLTNADGQTLLEYKYFDYDFVNDVYSCRVNCSILNRSIGSFETVIDTRMNLSNDIESLNLVRDVNGNIVQEEEPRDVDAMPETSRTYHDWITGQDYELSSDPFIYNDYMYGSTLYFSLVGNTLSIIDGGFTGKEVDYGSIHLEKGAYYFEVEFRNKNTDGDTNDILHFFNFSVQETILSSDLKQMYSDVIVSSFPVPNQTLLYTRKSEEGTLYYYANNGKPFTYIQEPFYMYYNGVDLKSREGVSLFTLNNSYNIFYLQNGLVRCGFNRLNGEMYLSKYDTQSKSYVNVTNLQLTEYVDFEIGAFSDDKIEVKVGKTIFTMYRGYPYLVIKHSSNDINFITTFNKVYSEGLNGASADFPVMWELVNSDNLLPECVAGSDIKSSCLKAASDYNDAVGTNPILNLTKLSPDEVYNDDIIIFKIDGIVSDIDEEISLNRKFVGSFGTYTSEIVADENAPYHIALYGTHAPMMINETNEIIATLTDYDYKGIGGERLSFYEIFDILFDIQATSNPLTYGEVIDIQARVHDEDGSPVTNKTVEFWEEFKPSEINILGDTQVERGKTTDIIARLSDDDGSPIREEYTIKFYEVYEPSEITLWGENDIIENSTQTQIYARVSDEDGSIIGNEPVAFYELFDTASVNLMFDGIIERNNTIDISARVTDEDGSLIPNKTVLFSEQVDDTGWWISKISATKNVVGIDQNIHEVKVQIKETNHEGEPQEGILVMFYEVYDDEED